MRLVRGVLEECRAGQTDGAGGNPVAGWSERGRTLPGLLSGFVDRNRTRRLELEARVTVCTAFSRSLRSGLPIEASLAEAIAGLDPRLVGRVRRVVDEVASGRPLPDAIGVWISTSDEASERLVGQAIRLAMMTGGELARCVDAAAMALRDQLAVESRRRVLTAQATASAAVLVSLPVAFAVLSSVLRGGLIHDGRAGFVLAAVGVLLDGLGLLWMKRLRRSLL